MPTPPLPTGWTQANYPSGEVLFQNDLFIVTDSDNDIYGTQFSAMYPNNPVSNRLTISDAIKNASDIDAYLRSEYSDSYPGEGVDQDNVIYTGPLKATLILNLDTKHISFDEITL